MGCQDFSQHMDPINAANDTHLRTDGGNVMLSRIGIVDGWQQWPSIQFVNEPNTGLWRSGPGQMVLSVLGQIRMVWQLSGFSLISGADIWATIQQSNTANQTYNLPNKSGTFALLDDITTQNLIFDFLLMGG